MCGKTIPLNKRDPIARLAVNVSETNYECLVTVESELDYEIAYTFNDLESFNLQSQCKFSVSLNDSYSFHNVCFSNANAVRDGLTYSNNLDVLLRGDASTVPSFEIIFVSVRTPDTNTGRNCEYNSYFMCSMLFGSYEIPSVCLDYSLICQGRYTFCSFGEDSCSDIKSNDPGVSNLTYVIIAATVVPLLVIGVLIMICRRTNGRCPGGQNPTLQETRSRAMAIFSTQLATRGVDSANDNSAYLDEEGNPIDFSKFDPPPEYGSLEHLDNIDNIDGTAADSSPDNVEAPPCYQHVMKNSDHFSVTTNL